MRQSLVASIGIVTTLVAITVTAKTKPHQGDEGGVVDTLGFYVAALAEIFISKECATTLFIERDVSDVPCLKHLLSRGLGVGNFMP